MWAAVTAIIILSVIILLISLLYSKATIELAYDGEIKLYLKFGIFKLRVYPLLKIFDLLKPKCRSMSRRRAEKIRQRLEKKQKEKDAEKKAKPAKKKKGQKKKDEGTGVLISDVLELIIKAKDILKRLSSLMHKHMILKLARLKIKIGSPDAATTALAYGAITQAINVLFPLLDSFRQLSLPHGRNISVEADFLSEKCEVDMCFSFSVRLVHILKMTAVLIYEAIIFYIDYTKQQQKKKNSEQNSNAQPKKRIIKRKV